MAELSRILLDVDLYRCIETILRWYVELDYSEDDKNSDEVQQSVAYLASKIPNIVREQYGEIDNETLFVFWDALGTYPDENRSLPAPKGNELASIYDSVGKAWFNSVQQ